MYLLAITLSLCASYIGLHFLLPALLGKRASTLRVQSLASLGIIFVMSILGNSLAFTISHPEFGNRVLHGFGGGFMAFLVCFLVIKDSKLAINKFQFFVLSALIVTALGVMNEIAEFFLQNFYGLHFSPNINDTWLDLMSNTAGILLAGLCLVPFINPKRKDV